MSKRGVCPDCGFAIDPTLVTKRCPLCKAELWRPGAARAPGAPRTMKGPVALAAIAVLVAGVGGAIYVATQSAIGSRGREAPLRGDDPVRTAALQANKAIADARAKMADAVAQMRGLAADPLATPGRLAPEDENYQWDSQRPPLVVAGADGADAYIVGRVRLFGGGSDTHLAVAVYDAKAMKRLWRTDSLGTWSADTAYRFVHAATVGALLFVVDAKGRATIHDVATGAAKARLTLSDRVEELCQDGNEVWLAVRDQKHVTVDVAAGRARRAKRPKACGGKKGRRPWSEYCGRVSGAHAPEATCRGGPGRRVGVKLEGMSIDRVLEEGALEVAVGQRTPGTPYPLLAGLSDEGDVRWRRALHEEDPDAAAEGTPRMAELKGGRFVVAYALRTRGVQLASLDAATGKTQWRVALEKSPEQEPEVMRMTKTRLYLMRGGALEIRDLQDGRPLGWLARK